MGKDLGGIEYTKDEALVPGKEYPEILDDSVDPNVGPLQDPSKPWRVFRGGSITEGANWCRSASRGPKVPSENNKTSDKYDFGFRVALTVTPDAIP